MPARTLSRVSALALGSAVASALAACASVPQPEEPPVSSSADRHRIDVVQTGERMEIAVNSDAMVLSNASLVQLDAFTRSYLRWGAGPIIMSTPDGGENATAADVVAQQARLALVGGGIPYAAIVAADYDGTGVENAPVVLTFSRYEARAPDCAPLWSQDLAHQSNNQAYESFGCATQANLAAMIEDPHDLLAPRDADPRDSARRASVMDAYRNGDTTHAERSSDERITISNAVR